MSLAVRVIPCLDVAGGRVVKGVNFRRLRDAGDPVRLAARYDAEGADELTFLDITASSGGRGTMVDVLRRAAEQVFIPVTAGGGVRSVADVDRLLRAGADKVSLNTAAVARPELLAEAAQRFGAQCVVLSVDARRTPPGGDGPRFEVTTHGGRRGTGVDAVAWAHRGAHRPDQLQVEAGLRAVGVHRVQQDLPRAQPGRAPGPLHGVDAGAAPPPVRGDLEPARRGNAGTGAAGVNRQHHALGTEPPRRLREQFRPGDRRGVQ